MPSIYAFPSENNGSGRLWSYIVCCLHVKINFRLCARGVRLVVWRLLLPLMITSNKIEANILLICAMFPKELSFFQIVKIQSVVAEKCSRYLALYSYN